MLEAKKKSWSTPQLIVLARGAPEESVLAACKIAMVPAGPIGEYGSCYKDKPPACKACSGQGHS